MATINYRFVWHRGLAADWTANNPVLLDGEGGLESDTDRFKFGDGVTAWNSLPYASGTWTQTQIEELARDALAAALTAGANITITPNDGSDTITIAVSGLGTMATQNANAVAITGGTVAGITSLGVSGNITATGNVHTFGPTSAVSGSGANLRLRNDAGVYQWLIGMLGTAGATEFNIGNGVTSTVLYSIDTTGNLKSQGSIVLTSSRHPQLRSYTVGTLPSAATAAQWIYVSNETGGAIPAFSDGTNWRRVSDRAIVA